MRRVHQDFKMVDVTFDTNSGTAMTIDANNTTVDTIIFEHCYFEANGTGSGQPDIFAATSVIRSIYSDDSVFRNHRGSIQTAHCGLDIRRLRKTNRGGRACEVESAVTLAPNDAGASIFNTGLVSTAAGASWKKLTFA